uniref:Beta-2-glycoprotein 1 n=1 Tax=Sarcophilus harrisii TaxID=9305 RepID=A0A7N4NSV9_SARHA
MKILFPYFVSACPRPPEIPFSIVVPLKFSYEPGETIVYSCKPGYVAQTGMRRFTCPLTGFWPINSLKCKPIICPPPSIPNFATLKLLKSSVENSSSYQDTAVFDCLPHYAMFGNDTIRCTEHGNWTELPECREVKCPFPTRPDNGFVNYPANHALFYKDKAIYGCHETYVLDGPEEVECGKFGTWSASPTCKASCKIPVKKATVLYKGQKVTIQDNLKNGILHGEVISFFCKNKERKCSYTEDAQCLDGNIEIPKCFKEHSSWAFWKSDAASKQPC